MQLSFFLFLISYFKNKYKPFLTVENNRLNTQITKYNIENEINIAAKVSFGFGDVNGCVIFKKYS